ncbi:MAG: Gfo/Idh/MocA family oxidoreductase [Thermodesulfovibrio sp.]|nr:Gfo/Idh/MocA family oxidoreductase [Thermodesulfovibrio sp.]
MKYKVVLIGAGYFGQRHLKTLSEMPDVKIAAVVDIDSEKLLNLAKIFNYQYFTDYRKTFNLANIFFIVTPTTTHYSIAKELIELGKDIFIEKPLTEKPELAKELIEEAKGRNIIFQVGLIERFNPALRACIELIENPQFISAQRVSVFSGRATDTSVIFDLMIHDLDLVWMILRKMGKVEVKNMKIFNKNIITDKIDFSHVLIDFSVNDRVIQVDLLASRVAPEALRKITLIQENNVINIDLGLKKACIVDKKGDIKDIEVNSEAQPLTEEIRDFLNSVKERKPSKIAPTNEEIVSVIDLANRILGG